MIRGGYGPESMSQDIMMERAFPGAQPPQQAKGLKARSIVSF